MSQRPLPSRTSLIRRGPYARLWQSLAVSSLGDWVTLFATFSLAAKISGGGPGAALSILVPLVGRILPGLLFGFVGGVVADRWSRKTVMVVADMGRAALVLSLLLVADLRQLFAVTFAIEVLSLMRQPAREAVVPNLIEDHQLLAANGLTLLAAYGTAPLGSALFAGLVEVGGRLPSFGSFGPEIGAAFVFDALTFLVSGLIVITIPLPRAPASLLARAKGERDWRAPFRDFVEGFRFVARKGPARRMIAGMTAGLFGGGALFVIGQPFSEQVLRAGDSGYGILVTSLGVGVGLGMLGVTTFASMDTSREPLFGFAVLIAGVGVVFAGFSDTVVGAGGWTLTAGLGTGVAYVTGFTHLHSVVTDEVRGRTFATLFAFTRTALLISFALAGVGAAVLDGFFPGELSNGIRAVVVVSGSVVVIAGTSVLVGVGVRGRPVDRSQLRSVRDALDSIAWMRGSRREEDE